MVENNGISEVYVCSNKEQKEMTIKLQPIHSGIIIGQIKNKKFITKFEFCRINSKIIIQH